MTTIAVLGTGIMGAPMARNLAGAGHDVRVWNRTRAKAEPLADVAAVMDTPAQAAAGADLVVTMLHDGPAVAEVVGAAELTDDQTWVQMSTVGQGIDDLLAQADGLGVPLVDAPVLGTRRPAEQGELTVLAAPGTVDRAAVEPVFDAVGSRTVWLDPPGAASRLKLVVNAWVLGLLGVLGETVAFAERLGVDPQRFIDTVQGTGVGAPYVGIKGGMMIERSYPAQFAATGARKDLDLILHAADATGMSADMSTAVRAAFQSAIAAGHGDDDMAAVVEAWRA